MVDSSKAQRLTPEAAKALADKVIETQVVPKKIPAVDDIDGQTKAIGGALASALLTATEMPLHVLQPWVAALSAQMVALGVRQTEHIDPGAVHAPAWITDGVKQQSIKLPDPPKPTEAEPVVQRTAVAPTCPKRVPKAARAVRR
ncbi:hypothetical protein SEA_IDENTITYCRISIS_18 [Mycobacterium phage IdentityCrisis]|uniref:Uncharacterized protein n=1 Tax=Mycobacterium phage IdentityCrisis TaxID=2599866 RepID=A0A5J6TI09_9CAUD|nr:hypothetical protein QEH37_gp18 [Mycobacterium phage IdentityCrisis]QFG10038.1 hypothetical protein SEA_IDENTITYCRISIS_18 [Mycobacterium phage IdentityCrisis]